MRLPPVLLAATVVCSAALLTGCGPRDSYAKIGLTVDTAGNPIIALQDCKGVIDALELSIPGVTPTATTGSFASDAKLVIKKPVKGVTLIPLQTGGNGWEPVAEIPAFTSTGRYGVQAWGDNHEWSGDSTGFTLADLKKLKPGQIRHTAPYPGSKDLGPDGFHITTLETFTPTDCS